VSQKKCHCLSCCNFDIRESISIVFWQKCFWESRQSEDALFSHLTELVLLIAYFFSNISVKNSENRFMFVKVVVRQSSDIFFWDTVYTVVCICGCRQEKKNLFNVRFGSPFRSHHNPTYFTRRLSRFADVYTSSLVNFLKYPLNYTFYPQRTALPHEPLSYDFDFMLT